MEPNQSQGTPTIEERLNAVINADKEPTQEPVVTEKQPEPMPSSEQKTTEEVKEPEVQEEATHAPEEDLDLPEGVSDRTRQQFEKLKARLRDAEQRKVTPEPQLNEDYGTSVFDDFRPQAPTYTPPAFDASQYGYLDQQQVNQIGSGFVDQEGNVDINGLNHALASANAAASRAQEEARMTREQLARFEETQQVREAHSVFPELDPTQKSKFDPDYYSLVKDRLLRNMYEGKKQTLLEVAKDIKKSYAGRVNPDKIAEEAVARYKESQQLRNQGPIESGKGQTRQPAVTLDELRARTRKGDDQALFERLKAAGV